MDKNCILHWVVKVLTRDLTLVYAIIHLLLVSIHLLVKGVTIVFFDFGGYYHYFLDHLKH